MIGGKYKLILAIVGMPGSGKSETTSYLKEKRFQTVRFGQVTDEGVTLLNLPLTPENERMFREKIRRELGMAAYAIKSKSKIENLLKENDVVIIDGLYSWEEYKYLKDEYQNLLLIHVYAEPQIRYKRLAERAIRPIDTKESRKRDIAELEKLNKGGPIAIADYLIENNTDDINELYQKIDKLLKRLGINVYD
ncbi:MAG: AAA family ATPase [Candidatus Levybacteria bacterium]|nr:AAA family ATPase [Candidatus Levybacteria bacterium]